MNPLCISMRANGLSRAKLFVEGIKVEMPALWLLLLSRLSELINVQECNRIQYL